MKSGLSMNKKQELIKKLEGKTVIVCKEELQKIDLNLFHNFLLENQNYKYYKLHFVNQSIEYTFANSFQAVNDIPPANYDFLSDWTEKELERWVDFIAGKEDKKITQITG